MSIFSKSEAPKAKYEVQILSAFNEPAAIFLKNGELKLANPEWRISLKDGKFERIFDKLGTNDAIFRLGKALRQLRPLAEQLHDCVIQVTPIGNASLVRCLSADTPPKKTIADNTESEKLAPVPLSQVADVQVEKLAEIPALSRANLASLIAGAPIGIARLNKRNIKEATIIGTNPAFVRISGIDSGGEIKNLVKAADEHLLDKLQIGEDAPLEVAMRLNPKTICETWLLEDGEQGSAILLIDITERLEMKQRLAHANKMEEIGRLTSGVAHELNNTLGAILLNAESLLQRHPVGDPDYTQLQEIRNTTGRSGNLVQSLLAFSRKQTLRREVLDIGDVLGEFSFLMHRVLDERVNLDIHHGRELPQVLADKQQIETMIMNLVTNARDAVLSNPQGRGFVRVRTRRAKKADVLASLRTESSVEVPDIEFCEISVTDNGTGMSEEVATKIFEPFYTTKETGKGTGIGMASVYGIVKQTGGFITIDTQEGGGTTFCVFLPAADAEIIAEANADIAAAIAAKPTKKRANNLSGQGRILLVEDEKGLRTITAQILKQRGYEVVEAGDGEEGLEMLEAEPNSFDLLISDVVMPIMDGTTMLKQAKPFLGNARVIFMSGYAEQDFSEILEQDRAISFLPKPFELVQLAELVKAELGGG